MRIAICGAPRCGLSTLAEHLSKQHDLPVVHASDFREISWDKIPDAIIDTLKGKERWILEGFQTGRVLRRWLNMQGGAPPLASVYWLEKALSTRTDSQESLARGVATVFESVRPLLHKKGVPIFTGHPMFSERRAHAAMR